MKLGFVSAILPELAFAEVIGFAAAVGYQTVEIMAWPKGKAERRYAGVTHIDVTNFAADDARRVHEVLDKHNVDISGLGYYPNPLTADRAEAQVYSDHIKAVIVAAQLLGLPVVNTFVGRDQSKTLDDNWPRFLEVWTPLVKFAEDHGVKIAIENCPMLFTKDEWPGGKNLARSPAIWRRMYEAIPSPNFGLNFDPSHFIWQQMDYVAPLAEFKDRLFHIHAKDARLDVARLNQVGQLAYPNEYHTPKLPGLGDVDWGRFFGALTDAGYTGPVCVEVEDRAYEGDLARRKLSLIQSYNFLSNYVPKNVL